MGDLCFEIKGIDREGYMEGGETCQNLSASVFKTARAASWTSVDEGCHGWIWGWKMIWTGYCLG